MKHPCKGILTQKGMSILDVPCDLYEKYYRHMKQNAKKFITVIIFILAVQIHAQHNNSTFDRFPFEYNKRSKTPEVSDIWNKTFLNLKNSFMNDEYMIVLHSYSSATGKKEYNFKLSKDRAKAVKKYLVGKGVDRSRITIEPHGEPNVEGYGDEDYAGDRNVLPIFKIIEKEKDDIEDFRNKERLDDDIEEGNKIFLKLIKPYVKYIKEEYHLKKLPGPGRPSKDVDEFLQQTKEVYEDAKGAATSFKELAKVVTKYGSASFIDLFTSLQAGKVAAKRKQLYDVIGEAFATECFPQYQTITTDYSIGQKYLFYVVKYEVSKLSTFDKYKLRVRFIAGKTHTTSTYPRIARFENSMYNDALFIANIRHYFARSDTRYKD